MSLDPFAERIQELGRLGRERTGAADVKRLKLLIALSKATEISGRVALHFAAGPFTWIFGVVALAFHLAMESQFMHAIMHGAYVGLPGAKRFTPNRFDTIAVPLQCRTWGLAHAIHHKYPSLLDRDPDALHPLYRIHEKVPWRPLHRLNTFFAPMFVFENCVFNYDRLLKKLKLRKPGDRGELKKLAAFVAYQYVLFPVLAGPNWEQVLAGTIIAVIARNLLTTSLQMASSVGYEVSTLHHDAGPRSSKGEVFRFQIETSKNYVAPAVWRPLLGGLDRHIEHHLYPNLPPSRLHDFSAEVKKACIDHGVRYFEFRSFSASLADSLSYLQKLSYK